VLNNKFKSYTLVVMQLVCIGIIAFTGPFLPENIFCLFLAISGGLLGLWAIIVMELGRFNITPEIHPNSQMVRRGTLSICSAPYVYIGIINHLGMGIKQFHYLQVCDLDCADY
jgi:hypothetical protein